MPSILIVDDESGIRALLKTAFTLEGFEAHTAASAQEAMETCQRRTFDVALVDVRLSGPNGHDLVRWLAANMPVVRTALMTGFDVDCDACPYRQRCLVLNKPFVPSEAVALAGALLARPWRAHGADA